MSVKKWIAEEQAMWMKIATDMGVDPRVLHFVNGAVVWLTFDEVSHLGIEVYIGRQLSGDYNMFMVDSRYGKTSTHNTPEDAMRDGLSRLHDSVMGHIGKLEAQLVLYGQPNERDVLKEQLQHCRDDRDFWQNKWHEAQKFLSDEAKAELTKDMG